MVARLSVKASTLALIAAFPAHALAQCTPDPTQPKTAVTCSGTDTNGIVIGTNASPLGVNSGASVTNGGNAITVAIPASASTYQRSATITVDGSVSSTSGIALYTPNNCYTSFSSITNQASGTIGAISANFGSIINAGTINGGSLSAIYNPASSSSISNSGTITSASSAATINTNYTYVTNSGTITNTGSGSAVDGYYSLNVTHQTGGKISSGGSVVLGENATSASITNSGTISNTGTGAVAFLRGDYLTVTNNTGGTISTAAGNTVLSSSASLNLVNKGTITGNVVAGWGSATDSFSSTIDSTEGTINGNLTLGRGSDILVATLKNGSLYTGITGTIDGGAGNNRLQLKTTSDVTLPSNLALPTNFSMLEFAPASGTTATLTSAPAGRILFGGAGTLENKANITGTGQIIGQGSNYGGTFKNSGSVSSSNASTDAIINLSSASINNSGTIQARRRGQIRATRFGLITQGVA